LIVSNKKSLTNINASLSTNPTYNSTYGEYNKNLLQKEIDAEWKYATDIFTIEEELTRGSNVFSETEVRINHILSEKNMGKNLGDDWRSVIFQNVDHVYGMGHKYRFNDNYWITIQTDFYKFLTASAAIRRCNNVLRWIDENGNKIEEPCIINYDLKMTKNDDHDSIITPKGNIEVIIQYNDRTKLIKANQRFLFGDPRKCYRVRGDGVNNFLNKETYNDSSAPLIYLYMDTHNINLATDDLVNGYADVNSFNYSVQINQSSFSQIIGNSGTLTCTKLLNGSLDDFSVMWSSDNSSIATIDNLGNYSLLSTGDVILKCSMTDNNSVSSEISIHVDNIVTNVTEIVLDNQTFNIYQGSSEIYGVYLYIDGIMQSNVVNISASNVPSEHYLLEIIDSNHFKITNKQMCKYPALTVNLNSGVYSKTILINLKGVW